MVYEGLEEPLHDVSVFIGEKGLPLLFPFVVRDQTWWPVPIICKTATRSSFNLSDSQLFSCDAAAK